MTQTPILDSPAVAPIPMLAPATGTLDQRRARLRNDVVLAARVLPVHYPLETFIAVNPLGGLEDQPFDEALRRAGDLYGARGTLTEAAFRAAYGSERVTDADLDAVLACRYPNTVTGAPLRLGAHFVTPAAVLRTDLLHGAPAPDPARRNRVHSEHSVPAVTAEVDAQTGKWCAAFLSAGSAAWPMPGWRDGFYPAWRALAGRDRSLSRSARTALRSLPERTDDAVLQALHLLGIEPGGHRAYLQAHLTRLPGWAAHMRWRSEQRAGEDLLAYLAVRLTYEALLLPAGDLLENPAPQRPARQSPSPLDRADTVLEALGVTGSDTTMRAGVAAVLSAMPVTERGVVWLEAYETSYRDALLAALDRPGPAQTSARPDAQVVCCIDARSEGLRRHLETHPGYDTLGFAGFFAVAIRFTDLAGGAASDLCPVLLNPTHTVTEQPTPGGKTAAARRLAGLRALAGAEAAFHGAKDNPMGPFVLAEAAGWAAAPLAAAKTLAPRSSGALRRRLHTRTAPPAPSQVDLHDGFPPPERVLFAQVALTTMGLTDRFARLVVLCGHGSSTENNPYQAALDCGACGGHRGGPNARTAAAILNDPSVRTGLRERDIDIPADTWFVAAEHDTATDTVTLLDRHLIPASHHDDTDRVGAALAAAGDALATERCAALPGAPGRTGSSARAAARHVAARSTDWAQVYPEWGLAGNAAFIVGPRSLTKGVNLHRRAFLHSYEPDLDPDGTALETILTAPLVVAQWINCQYYFSTVAPEVFGAGTKTIHNVIGGVGVLAGHNGDLQLGLPWQSVADGDRIVHEPMRLLAVVQAPPERIETIIGRNPILQRLFGNDWVGLAARERPTLPWQRYTRRGWQPWTTPERTP